MTNIYLDSIILIIAIRSSFAQQLFQTTPRPPDVWNPFGTTTVRTLEEMGQDPDDVVVPLSLGKVCYFYLNLFSFFINGYGWVWECWKHLGKHVFLQHIKLAAMRSPIVSQTLSANHISHLILKQSNMQVVGRRMYVKNVMWTPERDIRDTPPNDRGNFGYQPLGRNNTVEVYAFLGVPYAMPPTAERRFKVWWVLEREMSPL
jgi:hypothetical protein